MSKPEINITPEAIAEIKEALGPIIVEAIKEHSDENLTPEFAKKLDERAKELKEESEEKNEALSEELTKLADQLAKVPTTKAEEDDNPFYC